MPARAPRMPRRFAPTWTPCPSRRQRARPLPRRIPVRCMRAVTTVTWPWCLPPRRMSIARFVSSRVPSSATCSLCFSQLRKRPVAPRRCVRAAYSSATGRIASLASTYGPICPPARWRAVPVRCWRAQARRTFISMARASISPRPTAFQSRNRTMPRWRQRSFWLPSAS